MDIEHLSAFLGWCVIINIGILLYWSAFVMLLPNWTYRLSSQGFAMSQEQFGVIHYCMIGGFKFFILFFNVVPYFALRIIY